MSDFTMQERTYRFTLYKDLLLDQSQELLKMVRDGYDGDAKKLEHMIERYAGRCMDIDGATLIDTPIEGTDEQQGYGGDI